MSKKQSPFWRIFLLVLVALVLGLSLYSWNARSVLGNPMPMPFGVGLSVVLSGSMEPALSVGDLVVIRETDQVAPGDIVVYQSGNSLVIHRVIALEDQAVITQGDANNTPDNPVSPVDIKGKLALTIPAAGYLVDLLRRPPVVLTLLGAALLLTELSYRKEKAKGSQELEAIQQEIRRLLDEVKEET